MMSWLVTLLTVAAFMQLQVLAESSEKQLLKDLMNKYGAVDRIVRPVLNTTKTVKVKYGMALVNIQGLDEDDQVLTITSWTRHLWNDANLKWNAADYGGISTLRVPAFAVWRPDITLYNRFDLSPMTNVRDYDTILYLSGTVVWVPAESIKVYCDLDAMKQYHCSFKYGSWTYDGYKLDLDFYDGMESVDMSDFIQHHKWKVVENSAKYEVKYYPCCEEPYPSMTFKLVIARK